MKINDQNNYIVFCKRVFYDVLKGASSKIFSGGKPPDPHTHYRKRLFWYILYPLTSLEVAQVVHCFIPLQCHSVTLLVGGVPPDFSKVKTVPWLKIG